MAYVIIINIIIQATRHFPVVVSTEYTFIIKTLEIFNLQKIVGLSSMYWLAIDYIGKNSTHNTSH